MGISFVASRIALTFSLLYAVSASSGPTPEQLVEKAKRYQKDNRTSSAIIELKNALQKDPKYGEARLMLGQLYLTSGDPLSAVKELERALDSGVDKTKVLEPLLKAKTQLGRYQEVLGELQQAEPLTPELFVIEGNAYLAADDTAKARRSFESALKEVPDLGGAVLGLATLAWKNSDLVEARELFEKAAAESPESREVWLKKGEFELSENRGAAAQASFERASTLPGPTIVPDTGIARALLISGDRVGAEKVIDKILKQYPSYPMGNYLKALVRYQDDDIDATETALRNVLKSAPNHLPSVYLMGVVKYRQKQYAQAENNIARFLARFPENLSARKLLAAMQLQEKRPEAALETLEPYAVAINDAQGLALLGAVYMQNGRLAEATESLQKAAELDPDVGEIRTQLALSLLASGDSSGAVTELKGAVKLNSDVIQNDILLVLIALREGRLNDALNRAREFSERNPDNPIALNLLGAAQLAKADVRMAVDSFERALQIDPKFRPALVNLVHIKESQGDLSGGIDLYSRFLATNPEDVRALVGRAQAYLKEGNLDSAVTDLEKARSLDANALEPRLMLSRIALIQRRFSVARSLLDEALEISKTSPAVQLLRGQLEVATRNKRPAKEALDAVQRYVDKGLITSQDIFQQLALLQMQVGDVEKAKLNLNTVVKLSNGKNADALGLLARLNLKSGEVDAASEKISSLEKLVPGTPGLAVLKGDLEQLRNNTVEAEKYYKAGADSGNREATLKLSSLYSSAGQRKKSIALMENWLNNHPEDDAVTLALASSYLSAGENAKAIDKYESLKVRAQENPVILNNLAWLYFQEGDPQAESVARRAYGISPDSPDISDTLGWILFNKGSTDESLKLFQEAARSETASPSIHYHLALNYLKLNRKPEAIESLEVALSKGAFPEREQAQTLLNKIGN